MAEYSSRDVLLYLNAFNRTFSRKGVTKSIDDIFWNEKISPILYPIWDSDRDKLETYVRYSDGYIIVTKTKYQRNQKTGEYKWVSYEMDHSSFPQQELDQLHSQLELVLSEYRGLLDIDVESKLAQQFARANTITWQKLLLVRKFLLDDSDWTQLPDNGVSDEDKSIWCAYRQKLRDIPQEQESIPPNAIRFPITPTRFKSLNLEGEYLSSADHYYVMSTSSFNKYTDRIVTYLTLAIQSGQILDESEVANKKFVERNTLDAILNSIESGGL